MTRKCCIKSCAGEFKSESENRQFFKFPTDEEAYKRWLKIIGENLREGRSHRKHLFICNVHFAENCFYNNALKILKDGCEVEIPRKILKLKEGSIPSIFKGDSQNPRQVLTLNNCRVPGIHVSAKNCEKSNFLEKNKVHLSKKRRSEKRQLSPNSSRRVDHLNQIMSLPYSESFHESLVVPPSECTESVKDTSPLQTQIKYSKANLIKDWNARDTAQFPDYWGIHSTTKGILFVYIGDLGSTVTRSIFVKEDMTVEITAYNHVAKFPVLDKVSSLEELRMAMIKMVCLSFCERACQGLCKNGFYIPKSFSTSKKCKDCQLITKREKCKELRTARRLVLKSKKTKNNLRNIKDRLSRTTKKMENMQQHIEDLLAKCSR